MTPEQLKASILQYAIQGKLVEQRPEEGTAEDLYQHIQEEKQKLIQEGKIKKEKPLAEITEDETPFDIPENWKWVRLRDICTKIVDGDHNPPAGHNQPTEYLMLSATNINQNKIVELDKVRYVTKETFEVENQRTNVEIDDIFFTIVGSMGRSCVYKGGLNICFQRSVSVLSTLVYPEYLKYTLDTPYIQDFMYRNATGTAQKGFYLKQVENLVVAIPPLEEQHRIVAKIEELLPYLERYAKAYEKLEQFNEKFPEEMKKSILQYAIMGKLVDQRPEEGTGDELYNQIQEEKQKLIKEGKIKKEKSLADITEEEIPFEIPDSWKWCRIGSIFTLQAGKNIKASDIHDNQDENNKYLCYGGNGIRGYVREPNRHGYYAIIGRQGALCGCINFAEGDFYATEHAVVVDHYSITDTEWGGLFLKALNLNQYATATAQPGLAVANINQVLIPLPPVGEQKRIVEKIHQLMPLCDRLVR